MNAKIEDLMVSGVMSASPSQTIGRVREVMNKHNVGSMPVLNGDGEPVGIVTATDVLRARSDGRPVSEVMSKHVYTVPRYADPSIAARIMRNHRLHHVLVTHERRLVGILSSFDLLALVEDHRFVMKNPPTTPKRGGTRKKDESRRD